LEQPAESAAQSSAPATPETPAESPHPGEATYPDLAAESAQPEPEAARTEELTAAAVEGTRPEDEAARTEDEAARTEEITASAVEAARLRIGPNIEPSIAPRTQPRIQPVSTGEIVAANPPGRSAQQGELFEPTAELAPEPAAAPPPGDAATTPARDTPEVERSEPAAHHG
jgi:hypothetical protein